jgi:hypothetical protein
MRRRPEISAKLISRYAARMLLGLDSLLLLWAASDIIGNAMR